MIIIAHFSLDLGEKGVNMRYFAAFTSIPGNMNNFRKESRRSCPVYTGKFTPSVPLIRNSLL